ncbi:MAG: bifunctional precorrin-2 dehydrogenase/sirohydrochlorin ferrochelatase [Coriobacteriia bacterium]|nr:bifunctional precorrin-2 dehydrogenase/sirohydrochlorin ferrochelatase [Coriobacteriia bacterium]
MAAAQTYPIALVLHDKDVVVIGGGAVALRKVVGLLECGARITVVAPELCPELAGLAAGKGGCCRLLQRPYESGDLRGASLVFACTDDYETNTRIAADATQLGLPVNVADCPELCSFYLPSVLRRDALSIAVSTDGSSPLAARLIREELEGVMGPEVDTFVELLRRWREKALAELPAQQRAAFWQAVADTEVYSLVRQGRLQQAETLLSSLYAELL